VRRRKNWGQMGAQRTHGERRRREEVGGVRSAGRVRGWGRWAAATLCCCAKQRQGRRELGGSGTGKNGGAWTGPRRRKMDRPKSIVSISIYSKIFNCLEFEMVQGRCSRACKILNKI
jgi:hypothetical protein